MKHHHLTLAGWLFPLLAGCLVWALILHERGQWIGLGICLVICTITWPLTALGAIMLPRACFALVFHRNVRRRYRHWENRPFFWAKYGREYARSAKIRAWLHNMVMAMDQYQCAVNEEDCDGPLHVDHYCPWSRGGLTWPPNLGLLCEHHNLVKSNCWWFGYYRAIEYHNGVATQKYNNKLAAIAVLKAQQRHRRNPLRWLRAAWSLAW